MSVELKNEILQAVKEHADQVTEAIAKSEHELKELGRVTDETKNQVAEFSEKFAEAESRLSAVEQMAVKRTNEPEQKRTLGQMFVESDEFKEFACSYRPKTDHVLRGIPVQN